MIKPKAISRGLQSSLQAEAAVGMNCFCVTSLECTSTEPPKWCTLQIWELSQDQCLSQDRVRDQYQWDHQVTIKLHKYFHYLLNWCWCLSSLLASIAVGHWWIYVSTVTVSFHLLSCQVNMIESWSPAVKSSQHTFLVCKSLTSWLLRTAVCILFIIF